MTLPWTPTDEVQLSAETPNLWFRGGMKHLELVPQLRDPGDWGVGTIQYTGDDPDGPYLDIEESSLFDGPSPFQGIEFNQPLSLGITTNLEASPGVYHFRCVFDTSHGEEITAPVQVTVKNVQIQNGTVD